MDTVNVLITCVGSAAGNNCVNALRQQEEIQVRIFGSDTNRYSAGLYQCDAHFIAPSIDSPEYIPFIMDLCRRENVHVILPTFSGEILLFSKEMEDFAKVGVALATPIPEVVAVFQSKWQSYNFFRSVDIPTPITWLLDDLPSDITFPIFIKPDIGSGTRNSFWVDMKNDLQYLIPKLQGTYVVQPFITGKEFTVDAVVDRNGTLLVAAPRERIRTRNGMVVVSRTSDQPALIDVVNTLIGSTILFGPLNVQAFLHEGRLFVIDVNTRFAAGGLPLSTAAGANVPLIILKLCLGIPIEAPIKIKHNMVMLRYYSEIFIEDQEQL